MKQRVGKPVHLALILVSMAFVGCSTTPDLKLPDPLPANVKEYKHVTLQGSRSGMVNSEIFVEKGQLYSILAEGSIDLGSGYNDVRPEHGWPLILRIGRPAESNWHFSPLYGKNGNTLEALNSGDLYLGVKDGDIDPLGRPYNPQYYRNNTGTFQVVVITWKEADWAEIAAFFERYKQLNPNSKPIGDARTQAEMMRKWFAASKETEQEIEATKKEIEVLVKSATAEKGKDKEVTKESESPSADKAPIVADESVFTIQDAFRVLTMGAADIPCVKTFKPGGLHNSKKIAAIAEACSCYVNVGGTAHGARIEAAVGAHFYASTRNIFPAGEFVMGITEEDPIVNNPFGLEISTPMPEKALVISFSKS